MGDHYPEDTDDTDTSRLMTPSEVADLFGVNSKTVTRWSQSEKLPPALRTLGGHRRYREAKVMARLRAGVVPKPRKPGDDDLAEAFDARSGVSEG